MNLADNLAGIGGANEFEGGGVAELHEALAVNCDRQRRTLHQHPEAFFAAPQSPQARAFLAAEGVTP